MRRKYSKGELCQIVLFLAPTPFLIYFLAINWARFYR